MPEVRPDMRWTISERSGVMARASKANPYAIPTMEGLDSTKQAVERFIAFAKDHQELTFLVTPIGCGIAGYTPREIAPFFADAQSLANIYLPESFFKVLMSKK